jgi:DNA-binding MarR family transcriptional regulator
MSSADEPSFAITREVRDTCFCLHAQQAARAVARRYDEALRPLGLTNGQFSLLMSLNRPTPASIGDVSLLLAMDRTTVTANLKPLERRRLVTVTLDPEDRRSRRMTLTPAGRELLAAALPQWRRAQAATERHAAGTDPDRLRAVLRALA